MLLFPILLFIIPIIIFLRSLGLFDDILAVRQQPQLSCTGLFPIVSHRLNTTLDSPNSFFCPKDRRCASEDHVCARAVHERKVDVGQ